MYKAPIQETYPTETQILRGFILCDRSAISVCTFSSSGNDSNEQKRIVRSLGQELRNILVISAERETRLARLNIEITEQESILSSLDGKKARLRAELEEYRNMDSSISLV